MKIAILPDTTAASSLCAKIIDAAIRAKPDLVLGLATGGTPVEMYSELIRRHSENNLDFSQVSSFNLDEYLGVAPEHPISYRHFMNEQLFKHINIDLAKTHVPDGLTKDVAASCADYEAKIKAAGGIDIQILGIGSDGHIGFNEPSSSLASRTRQVVLTQQTRDDNARFFDSIDQVPKASITMGIGTILESRKIILLAFGSGKAEAVANMIEGPLSAYNPASALQTHPEVTIFLDEAAAARLKLRRYYQDSFELGEYWKQFV